MIGKFEAKITDYGVSETKEGRPQVVVSFEFEHQNDEGVRATKRMSWYGSLYQKAVPITLKQLLHCGLRKENFDKLNQLYKGPDSGMLDMERARVIEIQEQPHWQDASKTQTKIAWINDPELAPTIKKIDEATNNQFFGENQGQLMETLNKLATEMDLPPDKHDTTSKDFNTNDIPF